MAEKDDPEITLELTYQKFLELIYNPFFWIVLGGVGVLGIIAIAARRR